MDLLVLFQILLTVTISYLVYTYLCPQNSGKNGLKALPGPRGLPLVGYMPFLGQNVPEKITELGKTYGKIFQIPVGMRTIVVLNSYDVMRDALGQDWAFAGRPNMPSFQTFLHTGGKSRFALRPANAQWRFLQKCAVKALSLFASSGNSRLEAVVKEADKSLERDFNEHLGVPFDPHRSVFETTAGVIGAVAFGTAFERKDPLLQNVIQLTEKFGKFIQVGSALDFLPFGHILAKNKIKDFVNSIEPLNALTEKHIREHKCKDTVSDVADALFKTAQEMPDAEKEALHLNDDLIKFISQDLFGAGFATTMESFRWAIGLMAVHLEAQAKLQLELDRVLDGQTPTLQHRNKLPYNEAVLLEVLRFSSLTPFSLPHWTMYETELNGYYIPKDALVLTNLYGHHRNPTHFSNPQEFRPERFLISNQISYELDRDLSQKVLPFGFGKRRCVGENLARQELALLIASTFHKFKIIPAPGQDVDPLKAVVGFTRRPPDYLYIFERRLV